MKRTFKRFFAVTLCLAVIGVKSGHVEAMLAPAQDPARATVALERDKDLRTLQMFLERKEVRHRLAGFGLNDEQIASRLSNLSDADLHRVSQQIDKENPAGDSVGGILIIVVLVLLIIYLAKRV